MLLYFHPEEKAKPVETPYQNFIHRHNNGE